MNGTGQELAALAVVAIAAAYLVRRFCGISSDRNGGSCGCASCPLSRAADTPLVPLALDNANHPHAPKCTKQAG
jgi:hypothetical protein